MNLWHIDVNDNSTLLDMNAITILRGHHKYWFTLARNIFDFFNNRDTEVKIYEDSQILNKREWECILLPYNVTLQLDKITTKSPLQSIVDKIVEILVVSPQYQSIIEEWELLKEEEEIINKTLLAKYDLHFELKAFDENNLKDFISLSSHMGLLTPLEIKSLFLKLLIEREVTKRVLLIVELPEIYADENELSVFFKLLTQLIEKGYKAIIITNNSTLSGQRNYLLNNQIINNARLEMLKNKIQNIAPVAISDDDFVVAKGLLLSVVDKWGNIKEINQYLNTIHKPQMLTIYIILKVIGIELLLDTEGFPVNIQKFLVEY